MSQPIRRFLAAMSMAAALLLALPAPSQAAAARRRAPERSFDLATRAWLWLESLLGHPRPGVQQKDILTTPQPLPSPPSTQGPAIDPDGRV
jgi:hypothetical protein